MRIGELAGLVGISTRAIRHYHRVGLLPEPARKANGYREYSLRDAVELARVRRLTELGLSLDEVGDALAGDAGRDLVEILRELDADLARQEADLRRRRARLAQLLRQAEAGGEPSEQAPVSPELAGLFDRMAHVAAGRPGPEPAMAAKDRDLMALLETASPGPRHRLARRAHPTLDSDPGAVERAYAVYARLDELAGSPADDPRVEAAAQAIVAAIPEPARQAIRFPDGDLEETGFAAAFYADFAPAQAAAIRRAAADATPDAKETWRHVMTSEITSPAANVELVRAGFQAFNAGDADECMARIAPDLIINLAELPEPRHGREAWRQGFEMMRHAFPDLRAHIEDIVAAGDKVAVRLRFRGTHPGEFLGFAATGRTVEYVSHEFYRIAGGLIAEEWICSDTATLLRQLS